MSLFTGELLPGGKLTVAAATSAEIPITVNPVGNATCAQTMLINTANVNRAAGHDGIKVTVASKVTAMTGTVVGVNARANNSVDTSTGKIVGVKAYAANNNTSADLTVHGAEIWALTKGKAAATVRGAEIGLDFDGGETVTDAVGVRVVSQAGGTITNHYGVQIVDDSASTAGGRVFDGFIEVEKTASQLPKAVIQSTVVGWATTSANGVTLTAGDVPLFDYKDADGTAHTLVMTDSDTVAIRT